MANSLLLVSCAMVRPVHKLKGCFVEHHSYTIVQHNQCGAQPKELLCRARATCTSTIRRRSSARSSCSYVEQTQYRLSMIHECWPFSDAALFSLESGNPNTSRTGRTHIATGTNKGAAHCMANTCARSSNAHNRRLKRLCSFQPLRHTVQTRRHHLLVE